MTVPSRGRRPTRTQGANAAATKLAYRVTYRNGVEKTFNVQAHNVDTGFYKVLSAAKRWKPRTPEWQLVRIEHVVEDMS